MPIRPVAKTFWKLQVNMINRRIPVAVALLVCFLCTASQAQQLTFDAFTEVENIQNNVGVLNTWDVNTTSNWILPTNAQAKFKFGDSVTFGSPDGGIDLLNPLFAVNVEANFTAVDKVNQMTLGQTPVGLRYSFQGNAIQGNSLVVNNSLGGAFDNGTNIFGSVVMSSTFIGTLDGTGTISASSFNAKSGIIAVNLAGSGGFTMDNVGSSAISVTLSGTGNTFSGGTNVNVGTLNANSAGSLGTGSVSVASGATLNFGASNVVSDSATLSVSGTLNVSSFSDSVGVVTLSGGTINGTGTLNATSLALQSGTISANLAGSAALTKTGAGTVTLTGTNTYSGGTTVSEGTLIASSIGTGNVSVTNGAFLQTDLTLGAGQVLGGSGTLTGNLVFNSGAILNLDPGLTNIMTITGTMSFTNFKLTSLTGFDWQNATAGTYRLLNGGSATFDATSNTFDNQFNLGGGRFGYFQSGSLDLIITAVPEPSSLALLLVGGLGLTIRRRVRL